MSLWRLSGLSRAALRAAHSNALPTQGLGEVTQTAILEVVGFGPKEIRGESILPSLQISWIVI